MSRLGGWVNKLSCAGRTMSGEVEMSRPRERH